MRNAVPLTLAIVVLAATSGRSFAQTTTPSASIVPGSINVIACTPQQVTTFGVHHLLQMQVDYTLDSNNPTYSRLGTIISPGLPGQNLNTLTINGGSGTSFGTYVTGAALLPLSSNQYSAFVQIPLPMGLEGYFTTTFYLVATNSGQALPGFNPNQHFYVDKHSVVTLSPNISPPPFVTTTGPTFTITSYRPAGGGSGVLISGLYTIPPDRAPDGGLYSNVGVGVSFINYGGPFYSANYTTGAPALDQDITYPALKPSNYAFTIFIPSIPANGEVIIPGNPPVIAITPVYLLFYNVDSQANAYPPPNGPSAAYQISLNPLTLSGNTTFTTPVPAAKRIGSPTALPAFGPSSSQHPLSIAGPGMIDRTNQISPSQKKSKRQ
jgi:hypothetical protein